MGLPGFLVLPCPESYSGAGLPVNTAGVGGGLAALATQESLSMMLTPSQAARELDLTPAAVRAAVRRGALPAVRVLGRIRLRAEDVARAAAGSPAFQEIRHAALDQPSSTAA